jgi:hypothetical protein
MGDKLNFQFCTVVIGISLRNIFCLQAVIASLPLQQTAQAILSLDDQPRTAPRCGLS